MRACRGLPGSNSLFFCFAKSKVSKRKGDPQSESLRFAAGNLRCSIPAAVQTTRLRLKQVWPDVPPPSALLGSARTGGRHEFGFGLPSSALPVLAGLEKGEGDGLKNLDVRRRRSRLVSRFSGSFSFFKEPRSGPDCGSPFLWLLSFGEAKESDSQPGDPGKPRESKPLSIKELFAHVSIGLAAKNTDKN